MKKLIAVFVLLFMAGCSNVKPYAEVATGHTWAQQADGVLWSGEEWRATDRCSVAAQIKVGLEHRSGIAVGVAHDSNLDCKGTEPFRNYLYVSARIGGFKKK